MAKTCMIAKARRKPKFKVRAHNKGPMTGKFKSQI